MRSTLLYGAMTLCLGSVLTYTVGSAAGLDAWLPKSLKSPTPVNATDLIIPHVSAASADESPKSVAGSPEIKFGMSREQVIEAMGRPAAFNADNSQWTYGDRVVLFNGDFTVGTMTPDSGARARHFAAANASEITPAAKSAKTYRRSALPSSKPKRYGSTTGNRSSLIVDYTPTSNLFSNSAYRQPNWLSEWSNYRDRSRRISPALRSINGTGVSNYGGYGQSSMIRR